MSAPDLSHQTNSDNNQQSDNTENITVLEDNVAVKARRMATLLSIEASAREAKSSIELAIKLVNDPRALSGFDQAFFLEKTGDHHFKTLSATSQDNINKNAPLIQMVEACAHIISLQENPDEDIGFDIREIDTPFKREQQSYPFRHFYWMPIIGSGESREPIGTLLIARKIPWRDVDLIVLRRIIDTYAHAWEALKAQKKSNRKNRFNKKAILSAASLAFVLLMFMPVPYTAVAPAQIVAHNPWIVSSPIDGVIETIHVNPNQEVAAGDILISFVDTALRNGATIADNELSLAEARATNIKRSALVDSEGRREIAIIEAERALAKTRQTYARELLSNIHIKATQPGVVLFSDKNDFNGKPVTIGEKIMEIANPDRVAISIEVPPGDGLAMKIGQPINVYLDVDPLKPLRGTLTSASFTPSKTQSGSLAYRGLVELSDEHKTLPRIGLRGSAKLNAEKTALGFWLFRKPIVLLRRTLGL